MLWRGLVAELQNLSVVWHVEAQADFIFNFDQLNKENQVRVAYAVFGVFSFLFLPIILRNDFGSQLRAKTILDHNW